MRLCRHRKHYGGSRGRGRCVLIHRFSWKFRPCQDGVLKHMTLPIGQHRRASQGRYKRTAFLSSFSSGWFPHPLHESFTLPVQALVGGYYISLIEVFHSPRPHSHYICLLPTLYEHSRTPSPSRPRPICAPPPLLPSPSPRSRPLLSPPLSRRLTALLIRRIAPVHSCPGKLPGTSSDSAQYILGRGHPRK